MKKNVLRVVPIALLVFMASCSQRLVDFTIISSKNVPITDRGTEFKKAPSRVKGVDTKWSILFIPGIPNMKEAIDRAIEKHPGAVALTDGVIYNKGWHCLLFGQNKYIVEGTPLYPDFNYSDGSPKIPEQSVATPSVPSDQHPQQVAAPNVTDVMRVTHIVDKGETLVQIANAYRVSVADIMKWNSLASNAVTAGMKIIVFINQ